MAFARIVGDGVGEVSATLLEFERKRRMLMRTFKRIATSFHGNKNAATILKKNIPIRGRAAVFDLHP